MATNGNDFRVGLPYACAHAWVEPFHVLLGGGEGGETRRSKKGHFQCVISEFHRLHEHRWSNSARGRQRYVGLHGGRSMKRERLEGWLSKGGIFLRFWEGRGLIHRQGGGVYYIEGI